MMTYKHDCKKATRRILRLLSFALLITGLFGCGAFTNMPFNGPIRFHALSATVPEKFIRDSTRSSADLWVFEDGNYDECILFSHKPLGEDGDTSLDSYVDYMKEQGAASAITTFLEMDAVLSTYTKEGFFCQEILFAYDGAFYAVALRGGMEDEFSALLDTVSLAENTNTL